MSIDLNKTKVCKDGEYACDLLTVSRSMSMSYKDEDWGHTCDLIDA